jgi:hypothetical protein
MKSEGSLHHSSSSVFQRRRFSSGFEEIPPRMEFVNSLSGSSFRAAESDSTSKVKMVRLATAC